MARSKSPAKRKAADADLGSIDWMNFEANALSTPLAAFALVNFVYAVEMMGFQLFSADMKPAFVQANPCIKYTLNADGKCAENSWVTACMAFFGANLLSQVVVNLCAAFRSDGAVAASLARKRCLETFAVSGLLVGGKGILDEQQLKTAIVINVVFAFWFQNTLRGQQAAIAGERDFHKSGNAGYLQLGFFACQLFYYLNNVLGSGREDDAASGADTSSALANHMAAWWALSIAINASDSLWTFELNTENELKENFMYGIVPLAAGYALTTQPYFYGAFSAQAGKQIEVLFMAFAAACAAFGFGAIN